MEVLSPDTQATLLLVGRFPGAAGRCLSVAEYRRLAKVLHHAGLRPADLLHGMPDELGLDRERLVPLLARGTALALAVEHWNRLGIRVIGRSDPGYPSKLRAKLRGLASPILFAAGPSEVTETEAVCVVGSRDATESGLTFAERLGRRCAIEDLAVVSGDARGIDRAAMDGALAEGGRVLGILADSLAKAVLSKRNRDAILSGQLTFLSPFAPEASFSIGRAMDRNKYLYAISDAAVIADSGVKGGTWAGAIENAAHGWTPAFVRLGPNAPEGNNVLATRGFYPITDVPEGASPSLRDMLKSSVPQPRRTIETAQEEGHVESERDDAPFRAFLDSLCAWLIASPQREDAIAARFDLDRGQVRRWVRRGRERGVITPAGRVGWQVALREGGPAQTALPL